MRLHLEVNKDLSNLKAFSDQTDDILSTVEIISKEYTESLDSCIEEVRGILEAQDEVPINDLNYYISYIPVLLYDLTSKIQNIGIKTDSAKMERRRKYNETYQSLDIGTVAHKTTVSQQASEDEQFIEDIFTRVYKKCESKVEMATLLHGSLKKILQWRISEIEISFRNPK